MNSFMFSLNEENKMTVTTCIEVVLIRSGNANYDAVLAKLRSLYNCEISECVDHPEYLRTVLNEVYKNNYNSIVEEMSLQTHRLTNMDEYKNTFYKTMRS